MPRNWRPSERKRIVTPGIESPDDGAEPERNESRASSTERASA